MLPTLLEIIVFDEIAHASHGICSYMQFLRTFQKCTSDHLSQTMLYWGID